MITAHLPAEVRGIVGDWRRDGQRVGFVPTMGNLHAGHLALVERAAVLADRVVVSIFVNPLQFGVGEDFAAYPRTLESDTRLLEGVGADLLYLPTVRVMYPRPPAEQTRVEVPGLSDVLCGASRPGHFTGVATVVCKLFNQVQPHLAVFGEKDFQQLLVIRRFVEDLDIPIQIFSHPTAREADGLAMSSRNGYLTTEERLRAPALHESLKKAADELEAGERDFGRIEQEAVDALAAKGFRPDYFSIRRAADLGPPDGDDADQDCVILAAAFLGGTRLIDNLRVRGAP